MSKKIHLAGGCFWGVEAYFSRLDGVLDTTVGYANGDDVNYPNPAYKEVCDGNTDYAEALEVVYDPEILDLETLLGHFFSIIDPTTLNCQAYDKGTQYRSGIYYTDEEELPVIRKVIEQQQVFHPNPIVTEVETLKNFFPAEDYHQDYLKYNPQGYCHIKLPDIESNN